MHHGVAFNFGSAKACSPTIFATCHLTSFFHDKDKWTASNDYHVHFYKIVLFPLTAILQLINFYSFIKF